MRHYIIILLALFLPFCVSTPVSADKAGSVYDRVMKSGTIRCGYGVWEPFIRFNFEQNKPEGLVVDLMEVIASDIGLELEWPEETGWANLVPSLAHGRVDVACSTIWNDTKRGRQIAFTDPIFYMLVHAYVAEDSLFDFQSIQDINNPEIRISVQDGDFTSSLTSKVVPNAKRIEVSPAAPWPDVMSQVVTGKADVVFLNHSSAQAFNKTNKKKLKKVPLSKPVTVSGNAFAVSIHETALKEMINNAVRNLIQTGEIEKLTADFVKQYPDEIILPTKPYQLSE